MKCTQSLFSLSAHNLQPKGNKDTDRLIVEEFSLAEIGGFTEDPHESAWAIEESYEFQVLVRHEEEYEDDELTVRFCVMSIISIIHLPLLRGQEPSVPRKSDTLFISLDAI